MYEFITTYRSHPHIQGRITEFVQFRVGGHSMLLFVQNLTPFFLSREYYTNLWEVLFQLNVLSARLIIEVTHCVEALRGLAITETNVPSWYMSVHLYFSRTELAAVILTCASDDITCIFLLPCPPELSCFGPNTFKSLNFGSAPNDYVVQSNEVTVFYFFTFCMKRTFI